MENQSVEFTPNNNTKIYPYLWMELLLLFMKMLVSKANGIQPALELCVCGSGEIRLEIYER